MDDYDEVIAPAPFLRGHQILQLKQLQAGPEVGNILQALIEAQVSQKVKDKEEAIQFVVTWQREEPVL